MHPFYVLFLNNSPILAQNEEVIVYHPLYDLLLLSGSISAESEPLMRYSPLYDLLMLMVPEEDIVEEEDLAAMAGSTIGLILGHYNDASQS